MTEGKPVVLVLRYIRYLDIGSGDDQRDKKQGRTLHPEPHGHGAWLHETLIHFLLPEIFDGIRPQYHTSTRVWAVPGINQSSAILEVLATSDVKEHTTRISSIAFRSGDSPPFMHRNYLFKFMMAASGRAQNDSMQAS